MPLIMNLFQYNPYLKYLTKGEKSLEWFANLIRHFTYLWVLSGLFIGLTPATFVMLFLVFGCSTILAFPLVVLVGVVPIVLVALSARRILLTAALRDQLALLQLTPISSDQIYGSLVLATIYGVKNWLTWTMGLCPYVAFIVGWWPFALYDFDKNCYVSPLGTNICAVSAFAGLRQLAVLSILWSFILAISLVGTYLLGIFCSVSLIANKASVPLAAFVALALVISLAVATMVLLAPEGFLWIQSDNIREGFIHFLPAAIAVAFSPYLASFGIYHFFRRRIFV